MSAIAPAVVLAAQLAAGCHGVVAPPETLLPIAWTESRLDPLTVGDNATRREYHPGSVAEAVALATRLLAAGHASLDLGAGQINTAAGHLQRRRLPLAAAFDRCTSLRVGAEVLAECYGRTSGPDEQLRVRAAIGCYNTGRPAAHTPYVRRVEAAAQWIVPALRVAGVPDAPPPVPAAPVAPPTPPCAPAWDAWALAACTAHAASVPHSQEIASHGH